MQLNVEGEEAFHNFILASDPNCKDNLNEYLDYFYKLGLLGQANNLGITWKGWWFEPKQVCNLRTIKRSWTS